MPNASNRPSVMPDVFNRPSAMPDVFNRPSAMPDVFNRPSAMPDVFNRPPLSFPTFVIGNPWCFPCSVTRRKGQKRKTLDSR